MQSTNKKDFFMDFTEAVNLLYFQIELKEIEI